ncbi:hypothetical protein SAMN02745857_01894 [Andreprevotia lacus DSM 23236]|jgi:hypothetical protein|uniref:DUF4399 domain-containing protein n=1 Tax=Andreprevotia lacus DSM 23236 TaxID=1121001 RepID=A0A1W1XK94_9NEIS|nr:DUF6130 family protein [Andreprevotia lacus]SMC24399.1 hypothetical protein SAMN02745857_01894 [Andreprevotia lacus DSM 23236]
MTFKLAVLGSFMGLLLGFAQAEGKPLPRIVIDSPTPDQPAQKVAIIQFHTENMKIAPSYGAAALALVPPVGHLHVTVDGNAWHWVHAMEGPVVIQGLAPGLHRVALELADPLHRPVDSQTAVFSIAAPVADAGSEHMH